MEMKHLAPYANPAQYPNGYPGMPGSLMNSLQRVGEGMDAKVTAGVPYAVRRNFENNLNPQTKHYVERSIENTLRGDAHRWWRADPSLARLRML